MSEQAVCRWGIMSTALIGRKNWQAIKLSGNGQVVAVASRSAANAEKYIDEVQSFVPFDQKPEAVEGYDQLLLRDDIDAVYVPLPTGLRKEWVTKAAEAGKHVMCEKPCGCDSAELAAMVEACTANNVQFMDGVMYMHGKRLPMLRQLLDSGKLGNVKRITTQFSFCGDEEFRAGDIRTDSRLEPLGCLGDLGWYTIRFALFVMNYEMPTKVVARMINEFKREDSPEPVPMELEYQLEFANGVSASLYNSFRTGHQQFAHVSGTKGHFYIPDFVLPYKGTEASFQENYPDFTVEGCDFEMVQNGELTSVDEPGNSAVDSQETNLYRNFASIVLSGKTDPFWPKIALQTQQIMDAVVTSARNASQPVSIT